MAVTNDNYLYQWDLNNNTPRRVRGDVASVHVSTQGGTRLIITTDGALYGNGNYGCEREPRSFIKLSKF